MLKMKKSTRLNTNPVLLKVLFSILVLFGIGNIKANASGGIYDGWVIIGGTTYNLGSSAVALNGANLGSFNLGASLNITYTEADMYHDGSGNNCSATLYYYITGTGGNGYSGASVSTGGMGYNSSLGGNNYKWNQSSPSNGNILNGLTPGTYNIAFYIAATGSNTSSSDCSGNFYQNNGGSNYVATFTILPTISSITASSGTYTGSSIIITGTGFTGTSAVSIGGVSATSFTVNSNTQITATIGQNASSTNISVTNSSATGTYSSYTYQGYISTASNDWNTGSTWLGSSVPVAGANVTITNAVTVTSSVTNAVNTLTINSGSSLAFSSSGALTATTVTNNGTLTMSAGTLTLAASGTLTNNTSGTSFTGGKVSFSGVGTLNGTNAITFNNLTINTGTLTLATVPIINGTLLINGGNVSVAPIYGASSTLEYGVTYTRYIEWSATAPGTIGTTAGYPNNVTIAAGTLTLYNSGQTGGGAMAGTLTIGSGTTFTMSGYSSSLTIGGNWTNNGGTFTTGTGTGVVLAAGAAQTISKSGGETFYNLTINNTSGGVSLLNPVTVSNVLTLTSGIVTTTSTNILSLSNTSNGAVVATTSFSSSTFINGPLKWSLPNSSSSNFIFPVGVGATYLPFAINSPSGTSPVVTVQAYTSDVNASATYNSSLTGLSHSEYWLASNSGTFSSGTILLAKSTLGSSTAVAYSTSPSTTFNTLGGTIGNALITGNTITSTSTVGSLGSSTYFVMGVSALPVISSFSASPGSGTSGYVGSTVTITGTNMGSATSLTVGGTSVTILTNTATQITFKAIAGLSGTITVSNAIGSGISGGSYADLGYISTASTDWNTGSTWLGSSVPSAGANVTIANAVTVTASVTNAANTLTINSGSSLAFSSSGALTATTVTNNGTLTMSAGTLTLAASGTLTNNTSGTSFTGGTVSFSGAGAVGGTYPVTFNNFLSISGVVNLNTAPTINGTLTINTLGGVATNSPYYGASSTLFYNAATTTGSPYHRSYEWALGTTSSASAGYPNNVTIGSSSVGCVLDLDNYGNIQMGGSLAIGAASGSTSALQMNEASTPYPLTVVGGVTVYATGTLLLGNLVSSYAGDLYVKGSFTNSGTLTTNSRAVFFNGSSAQTITGTSLSFPYLIISNTAASVTLANAITVSNTLTINSGATLNDGGYTLTVSGNSIVNNGTHAGSGEIKLTAGSDVTLSGTGIYQNLENALTSANLIAGASFSIAGNLTNTSGGIRGTNTTITFTGASGTLTNNATMYGEYSGSTLSLTFSGSTTLAGSTGYLDAKNYTISSSATLICGAIGLNTNSTSPAGGTVTINGTLQTSNTNGLWNGTDNTTTIRYASGNFSAVTLGGASTIVYNASGAQNVSKSNGVFTANYFNLTCSNTGTKTMQSSLSIGGTLTLSTASDYLSVNGYTLTLNGPYISGTVNNVTSSSTSSLVFNCTGAGPFTLPNFTAINNLTINTSGQTYNLNSSPTVSGTLTLTAGTFAVGSNTLTLSGPYIAGTANNLTTTSSSSLVFNCTGTGPFTLPNFTAIGGLKINSSSQTYNLNSSLTTSGTLNLAAGKLSIGSNTLTLGSTLTCTSTNSLVGSSTSNLTVAGTVGTVYFSGTTALNNLTINSGSVILGTALTMSGTVAVAGGTLELPAALSQTIPTFTMTSGTLLLDFGSAATFSGSYTATGGTLSNSGTITLTGTSIASFPGSGVTVPNLFALPIPTMYSLTVNIGSGHSFNLVSAGGEVNIAGTLTLTSGLVNTTTLNYLFSTGTISGANTNSYVNGPLGLSTPSAATYTFPVGAGGNYRPVQFTYTSSSSLSQGVVISQTEGSMTGLPSSASTARFGARYYTILQYPSSYAYEVGLNNSGATPSGTPEIVRVDGVTVSSLTGISFSSPNYTTSSPYTATTTATINSLTYYVNNVALAETAIPATITGVTANNKTYNGTTAAVINTGSAAVSGVVGSDVVTVNATSATGTFASANVANGITVTYAGFALGGANASAYTLSAQPTSTTANITVASLTITASAQSKTYGATLALGTTLYSTSGLAGTDAISSVTLTNSNTSTTSSPSTDAIGSYSIIPSAAVFSTGSSSNYNITYTNGTLTVNAGAAGTWVGVTSTNFSTASNWANNTVPTTGATVTVPSGTTYAPVLTASISLGGLTINSGATFGLGGQTLTVTGAVTSSATATITGSSTSNLTVAGSAGTIYFTTGSATLNNLTVSSGSVILGTAMTISGTAQTSNGGAGTMRFSASQNIANLTVGSGTTLTVDASTTTTITGTYSATSATVTNNGTLVLNWGANGTLFPGSGVTATMKNVTLSLTTATNAIVWKSASTTLISGTLTLTSGLITSTLNDLVVVASTGTISGGSSSSYINGPLSIATPSAATYTYPVGAGGNYRPVQFTYTATPSLPAFQAVTIYQTEGAMTGLPSSASTAVFGARYYTILQYPYSTSYTVGLNNSGVTPPAGGTPEIVRVDASVTSITSLGFSSPYYTNSSAVTASTTATIGSYTYYANTVALAETAIPLTITASAQSKTYGSNLSPLAASYSVSGLVGTDAISSVTLTNSNTGNGNSPVTDAPGSYTITPSSPVFSSGSIACYSPTYTTGTLTVNAGTAGTWLGITSTNFSTASNWQSYSVPASTDNITVGTGTTYLPVLTATSTINNLSLASGTTLGLNGQSLTINGAISGTGTITSTAASSLTIGGTAGTLNFTSGNNTIQNLTLNSSATVTLGGQLNIVGGATPGAVTVNSGATLTTGGNLVLKSDINGTARIAQSAGSISGNVTVERYITAKTARKYSYIGSPVTASVRNSWQQQIYVSGSGTGGTPCGTTSGDGGTTDKYNSNGFDATQNNSPTIYNYNATLVNGSRYVGIANTESTNLTPGTGYTVNIRGNRNSGSVTCANQLETSTPTAPEAVTLSATGTVTTGDLTVSLYDTTQSKFTLLANPYPCQISFSAFHTDNSTNTYNNMWTYSPFGNNNYTTYSNGVIANGATGFDNTSGNYIASGQAFFVQATQAGSAGTVTFHESHKTSGAIPNTQYFGNTVNPLLRIGLKSTTDNSLLDEVVVRYNRNGSNSYIPDWDASSLSNATQTLVSLKGSKRLAIATHPEVVDIDATQLGINSSTIGKYRLSFSDYQDLDISQSITLVDKYLNTTQDIRTNQVYDFNVTSDAATMGNNRFVVLVGAATALPVNFTAISATKAGEKVNVKWAIANEVNIASYEVERSTNGIVFETITTKKAVGTNSYTVEDASFPASAATLYYRIKAIGANGTTKYSSIASLSTHNASLIAINVYPNPVKSKLNITLGTVNGNYDVRITNATGRMVYAKAGATVTNGNLSLDASNLSSGVYVLDLTDNKGNKYHEKFIKE